MEKRASDMARCTIPKEAERQWKEREKLLESLKEELEGALPASE